MIYVVEMKYFAMVSANSAGEAADKARHYARDIVCDAPDVTPSVLAQVYTANQLKPYGWDDRCIPYGHDGNTRLKDLLESK